MKRAPSSSEDATQYLRACIARSPTALGCLFVLVELQRNGGLCEETEATSRQGIAAWPNSFEGYDALAAALYTRTRSLESTLASLERKWALLPEGARDFARTRDMANIALLRGDIANARRALDELEPKVDFHVNGTSPAIERLDLEYDLSSAAEVKKLANRYWGHSAALSDPSFEFRIAIARTLLRTGGMTEEELVQEREKWLATGTQGLDASAGRPWFNYYAPVALTPRLAEAAMRNLPKDDAIAPYFCENDCEATIGEAFFTAGDPERALPHLERATRACTLRYPLRTLRARHLLGRTLERLGRPKGACRAYADILMQWPNVHQSRIVQHARSRAAALRCNRSSR